VAAVQGLVRGSVSVGSGKALPFSLAADPDAVPRGPSGHRARSARGRLAGPHGCGTRWTAGPGARRPDERGGTGPADDDPRPRTDGGDLRARPRSQRARHRIAELADEPFVDFDSASVIRRRNDQWFAVAGIARRVAFSVNDVDTLLELVASGLGIAIVPDGVARRSTTVCRLALADAVATFETGAVVPANRPVSVAAAPARDDRRRDLDISGRDGPTAVIPQAWTQAAAELKSPAGRTSSTSGTPTAPAPSA
jgi:hypothetical protein